MYYDSSLRIVAAAIQMRRVLKTLASSSLENGKLSFHAGIATGTVVGGILGVYFRLKFSLSKDLRGQGLIFGEVLLL